MDEYAVVTDVVVETVEEAPPPLHDQTSLEIAANSEYGLSAKETMDASQELYEAGLISYPRTSSHYITPDMEQSVSSLLSGTEGASNSETSSPLGSQGNCNVGLSLPLSTKETGNVESSGEKQPFMAEGGLNHTILPPNQVNVGKKDLDSLRMKLGVPETDTIAAGKTNVKGLENVVFEGQSPKVRKEAGLPDLDKEWPNRRIKAPGGNPLFTRHAEEVVANSFDREVKKIGLNPNEVKGVLKIHQSNPTGVCRKCIQGLANDKVSPGVLKQLSTRYPNLRIEITSELKPNVKVTGRSNFVIQNGKFVE